MRIWWAIRFIIILGLIGVIFDLVKFRQFGVNAAVCTGSGEHFYFEHSCVYDSAYGYDCSNSQYGVDEECVDHGYPSCYYVGKSGTVCKNTGWNDSCAYTTIDLPVGTDGTCAWCYPDCSCAAWTCTGDTCTDPTCSTSCAGTAGATNGDWGDCDANCDRSCVGAYCGGTCTATKPTCAVNGTWGAWSPGCSPECGQPVTRTCDGASCGGTCLADGEGVITSKTCGTGDLGTPAAPTPIWPISVGTTIACSTSSIGLRWSAVNDGLADGYGLALRHESDPDNNLSWNTVVGAGITGFLMNSNLGSSGTYTWYVTSYNNTCNSYGIGTTFGDWKAGYFCKECETCANRCDQPRNCNNRVCTGEDNGNPLAPTPVSPTGTSINPAIFPLNIASITFDWNDVALLTDYYRVYVYDSSNTLVASNTGVSIPTTQIAFGPFNTAGLFHWYVQAINSTCNGINGGIDIGPTSTHQYFRINTTPDLNPVPTSFLVLKNSEDITVPVDVGSSNHICQPIFTEEASPPADRRQIKLVVTASDADGGSEISSIAVRLNVGTSANSAGGVTGQWSFISPPSCTTSGNNKTCTFHMNLLDNLNNPSLYNLEARVVDIWGATSGWVDSGRDLKIWDCLVDTSGSLYEAEDGKPVCANPLSYNKKIEPEIGFNSIVFDNTSQSQPVDMTETIPANYGPPDSLVWGRTYLPLINGGVIGNLDGTLLATNRVTRIIDTGGVGTTYCPGSQFRIGNGPQALISAYSINPSAQIDFSYIRDQEGWYQVVGAGVKGRTGVQSGVPVTALQKALTWSGVGNTNGLVSSNDLMNNINGCSESTCLWGNPNNWYLEQNTNDNDIYNYNYFYNNFYVKAGVGVTGTGWSGRPAEGVYFVKNGLTIDTGSSLADLNTKTMLVVVNGGITIAPNVKRLDGIYIADGIISVGGTSVDQLNINGMLYAGGSVRLYRSFTNKTDNNTAPAVKVNYSPGLIFNLPPEIMKVISGWREE